ncbi:hypothetical protein [Halorhabdus rudnickae]|uniref:hypothetical protein n=1 Tax=Halorhabdus rudnickae TaxID=1775544 RepID=UPI0010848DE2|nr:hypothetical protein [Halorhabdus rudnickae]
MDSVYVEVILGVSLGGIVGVVPAVAAGIAGGIVPSLAEYRFIRGTLAVASLLIAGVVATSIGGVAVQLKHVPRMVTGGSVVVLLTVFGFEQGRRVGSTLRRDGSEPIERGRSLADVAVDAIDASGQVTIRPQGAIRTVPGYPELPGDLQSEIAAERWRLPADLPLSELERRIERQLLLKHDLEAAEVTVNPRGTATVAGAPPASGIARTVPAGQRAVSVQTTVPDGVEPGDEIVVETEKGTIDGFVLSTDPIDVRAKADGDGRRISSGETGIPRKAGTVAGDGTEQAGGRSRVTVAVPTDDIDAVLEADRVTVAVRSRDMRPDFRAISLFDRAGKAVRVTSLDDDVIDRIENAQTRVDIFAARSPSKRSSGEWTIDPSPEDLASGWQVVLVGDETGLTELVDATASGGTVVET